MRTFLGMLSLCFTQALKPDYAAVWTALSSMIILDWYNYLVMSNLKKSDILLHDKWRWFKCFLFYQYYKIVIKKNQLKKQKAVGR